MYENDKRVVMTLDAGGTNFVFSAIKGYAGGGPRVSALGARRYRALPGSAGRGFERVREALTEAPVAISFAFPGPADYEHGIIGDLPNFPAFRGGVALGPFLEAKFGIPVYINNDGNLFAYGEALAGALPMVNAELKAAGNSKRYKNLLGLTLGTGFGAGVVIDGNLLTGDNGCGGDVWLMRNKKYPDMLTEESVSIRAVRRMYAEYSGEDAGALTPKDICGIADGTRPGNREAARRSFDEFGEMAGAAMVHALDIVDGIVVIGGGVAGAARHILPGMLREMRSTLTTFAGASFPCLQMEVFDLADEKEHAAFLESKAMDVPVFDTGKTAVYDNSKRIGIAISQLGANKAISLGAYAFALQRIDREACVR